MDFQEWLKQWVSRHPAKDLPPQDRAAFTQEVMRRVKDVEAPAQAPARILPWRWPTLALAGTAAVALFVVSQVQQSPQVAEEASPESGIKQIARAPQTPFLSAVASTPPPQSVALAKDDGDNEAWLAETLELLESLDEDLSDDAYDGWSDEDWMDEIEILDEDFFTSS